MNTVNNPTGIQQPDQKFANQPDTKDTQALESFAESLMHAHVIDLRNYVSIQANRWTLTQPFGNVAAGTVVSGQLELYRMLAKSLVDQYGKDVKAGNSFGAPAQTGIVQPGLVGQPVAGTVHQGQPIANQGATPIGGQTPHSTDQRAQGRDSQGRPLRSTG